MERTTKAFLFISLIAAGFAWGNMATQASSGIDKIKESKFYSQYTDFNADEFSARLQLEVKKDKVLNPLYASSNYIPIWTRDTLSTEKIAQLVTILSGVDMHGVSKQVFPTERIITISKAIDDGKYVDDMDALYRQMIELEELASTTALQYIQGMRFGFLNPKELYGRSHAIAVDKINDEYRNQLYAVLHDDAIATLLAAQPQSKDYLLLLAEYKKLDTLKDVSFSKIQPKGKAMYKLLDRGDNINRLSKRLALTGEYEVQDDSIGLNPEAYVLDEAVLEAVNEFRRKNTYFEENEIGEATIQALNRPMTYYQEKVKANLERYRWRRSKEKHAKHIEVNVASQLLIATVDEKPALEMRVAVGSLKNKTPLLQSDIAYINLNPVWNVPRSIATKELSVKQKNNPSYFKRNNMKVYKGGKEVAAESVNWSAVAGENFAYSIKQTAGDHNALGKVKFMFNNNFAVYLHDTPSKAVFNKKNRAVSHGCVRLHQPIHLALFLANPTKNQSYTDRLYHTIDMKAPSAEGQQLQADKKMSKLNDIIRMDEDVSLFIDYFTVYFKPEDKTLYYADDVYDYDKPILDGLAKLGGQGTVQAKRQMVANK